MVFEDAQWHIILRCDLYSWLNQIVPADELNQKHQLDPLFVVAEVFFNSSPQVAIESPYLVGHD